MLVLSKDGKVSSQVLWEGSKMYVCGQDIVRQAGPLAMSVAATRKLYRLTWEMSCLS